MGHGTLIGGTAYGISGGRTMAGGTAYSISRGKTMVGATAYDVSFTTEVSVKITGTGAPTGGSGGASVAIDGTVYSSATAIGIKVSPGDIIQFNVVGRNALYPGTVTIDGTTVLTVETGSNAYRWTVPSGISAVLIALSYNAVWVNGTITVTTS